MEKTIGITVKKSENFSEWYQQVVLKSELADYSKVSGCMIFRPYLYSIWEMIVSETDKRFKKLGIKNAYFPLFIPESLLVKEQEHVEGFAPEVAWVTHSGKTKLDERLAVRPTSETIMYDSYAKWIRSHRDLPLKINQWNNVVRWEFKHPVALLRTREFLWNEGHTVFATQAEAEAEKEPILGIYQEVTKDYMALHGITGRKSEKEKFAGALYTYSIEYFLPSGKGIQGPDFHHDGQNFAKAFNIKFLDKNEKQEFAWQNTWAITTRMIGVMVAVHGDDKGLVLPPKLAPIQVVIVPIIFDTSKEKVLDKTKEIQNSLLDFRTEVDAREEYTAGFKYNHWELKGIPIRIEIGPKDVMKDECVIVRRDNGEKRSVKIKEINKEVHKTLDDIHESLYQKSKKFFEENITEVSSMQDLIDAIKNKKMTLAPHCGSAECEDWIKEKTGGASTRVIPDETDKPDCKCVRCAEKAKYKIYFAKAY